MITIQLITATDELMSFVTMSAGPPREGGCLERIRGRSRRQSDRRGRRADCGGFRLSLPSLVEAVENHLIRPPGPHPDQSLAGVPAAAARAP